MGRKYVFPDIIKRSLTKVEEDHIVTEIKTKSNPIINTLKIKSNESKTIRNERITSLLGKCNNHTKIVNITVQ